MRAACQRMLGCVEKALFGRAETYHSPKETLEPSACSVERITCEPDDDKGDGETFCRLGNVVLMHLTERGQNLKGV